MSRPLTATLAIAALWLTEATPLSAQSSLGLNFAEATLGGSAGADAAARLSGDYRLAPAIGLQFGLAAADRPGGWIGQVEGHLYLQPRDDRKYGFFLTLADIDGRDATLATGGAEALWAPQPGIVLGAAAGAGIGTGGMDFIFARGSASRAIGDDVTIFAEIGLAAFDESTFSATGIQGTTGMRYAIPDTGFELSLALAGDRLAGRDSSPAETWVELGLIWQFGADRGARKGLNSRAFNSVQPVDPLIRRGLF